MNRIILVLSALVLSLLFSCTTDSVEDETSYEEVNLKRRKPVIILDSISPATIVYATGSERIWSINPFQKRVATVWVNGVATGLTDGTQEAYGHSIVVDQSNDIYVAGFESNGSKKVAKIWQNGVATSLTNGTNHGSANSVFIDNNDVYIGGSDGNNGKIWKNNIELYSMPSSNPGAVIYITSIHVYNSDIYACGFESSTSGTSYKAWKNGLALLNVGGNINNTRANSIFVNSTGIYVAGRSGQKAVVWKNGTPTYLSNGSYQASAESVYVRNSDVYVAGYDYTGSGRLAKQWLNGTATNLTSDVNGNAFATSIYVKYPFVYVGGTQRNPSYSNVPNVAKVWINTNSASWSTENYEHHISSVYAK
ncbi:hypothetical protein [Aquimarina sp. 2304DJ70-9]|uniref:hypothetical protein n=1 Tax=Aquimarina penaris TaxID=3231044 RepID=UPI003461A684